jgi:hypothetical protein
LRGDGQSAAVGVAVSLARRLHSNPVLASSVWRNNFAVAISRCAVFTPGFEFWYQNDRALAFIGDTSDGRFAQRRWATALQIISLHVGAFFRSPILFPVGTTVHFASLMNRGNAELILYCVAGKALLRH